MRWSASRFSGATRCPFQGDNFITSKRYSYWWKRIPPNFGRCEIQVFIVLLLSKGLLRIVATATVFFFVVVFVFVFASVGLFFGLLIFGGTQKVGKRFWFGRGSAVIHNVLVAIRLTIWMAKQQKISSICFKDSKCSFIASVYKPTWQGTMITGLIKQWQQLLWLRQTEINTCLSCWQSSPVLLLLLLEWCIIKSWMVLPKHTNGHEYSAISKHLPK